MACVAVYHDRGVSDFTFKSLVSMLRGFALDVDIVGAHDIIAGALTENIDLFVMPGGADEPYAELLGDKGACIISDYVQGGGAYYGICAGAYYACDRFEFNKGLSSEICRERPLKFFKGKAVGSLLDFAPAYDLTLDSAAVTRVSLLNDGDGAKHESEYSSYYHGGPVFVDLEDDRDIEVLGYYTDLPANQNAALLYKPFGKGRVVLCSFHPEVSAEDFETRLQNENNPQDYHHILNDLTQLVTGRYKLNQKILAKLLPLFLNS